MEIEVSDGQTRSSQGRPLNRLVAVKSRIASSRIDRCDKETP
ncbi:hypothetical protein SAMN05192564_103400 [Paraburkholderia sartisoli]|uniref:Uncharacterized protein n=1 Tax=Paraburkholderia sartisoli TaxID=83784 RepID=A0A1H4EIL9_9BURK|nr:hypothetical protein SAMN05192564_103400 [Paraburkholderia sartisoli]